MDLMLPGAGGQGCSQRACVSEAGSRAMVRAGRRALGIAMLFLAVGNSDLSALPIDFGVRAGAYLEQADPFVGFELLTPLGSTDWFFNPSVEVAFGDRRDRLAFNLDFTVSLRQTRELFVYGGAGVSIWRLDADPGRNRRAETEGGVNLVGGVAWRLQDFAPYAQLKIVVADDAQVIAGVGLRF